MVQVSSTIGEDTATIEGPVGGINSDCDGLVLESSCEGGAVRNLSVSCDFVSVIGGFAGLVSSDIGVLRLVHDSVVSDVAVAEGHQTTVASLISVFF